MLYTGTFSKALLPSLRIGYLVVPADLVSVFRAVRPAVDRCPATFQQRVIADFLDEGYFPAHLRRLRERLRASRDMLVGFLTERVAEHVELLLPDQGINLTVKSTGTWSDDTTVSSAALERGVVVMPLSRMNVATTETRSSSTARLRLLCVQRTSEADLNKRRVASSIPLKARDCKSALGPGRKPAAFRSRFGRSRQLPAPMHLRPGPTVRAPRARRW